MNDSQIILLRDCLKALEDVKSPLLRCAWKENYSKSIGDYFGNVCDNKSVGGKMMNSLSDMEHRINAVLVNE